MLDHSRIRDRLAAIRKRLQLLKETAAKTNEASFLASADIADAAEYRLQVAIQACLDIAAHIVSQAAMEKPKRENKELFLILYKLGVIDKKLAQKLAKMAGMRNILVHEYLSVAREKVYQAIKYELGDIIKYCQKIEEFLESQK
ncbi:DUF86 domain-containing protein [Candidatus Shapirobacteria bacterium]|nr:DUF86 domain-containing protein [Candidatus Shapirobacteria bacterium]